MRSQVILGLVGVALAACSSSPRPGGAFPAARCSAPETTPLGSDAWLTTCGPAQQLCVATVHTDERAWSADAVRPGAGCGLGPELAYVRELDPSLCGMCTFAPAPAATAAARPQHPYACCYDIGHAE